jgi:hypothetical protein
MNKSRDTLAQVKPTPAPQLAKERFRAAALAILSRRHGGVWIAVASNGQPV